MNGRRLIAALVAAEVLGMLGVSAFAALLPGFTAEWGLSGTGAGWIAGIYFAGYVAAVPVLVSLTDRVDPRRVYLLSTALGGVAALGFALTADGFWTAMLWRALAGVGLAGTYMPGLKALSDRLAGTRQSRGLAFYTGGFSIGVGLSFLITGEIADRLDWRWAFGAGAIGSALALALAAAVLRPAPPDPARRPRTHLLDFRPVLRNRAAMTYALAYGAHVWEMYGFRGWIVAFLVFSQALQPPGATLASATLVATGLTLVGLPASVLGNELCLRFGRRRTLAAAMAASALFAGGFGFAGALSYPVVVALAAVYGVLVMADSAGLTAGAVAAADPRYRGATMAVHSSIGFLGAFLGPLAFGAVLDLGGGTGVETAWGFAFAGLGVAAAAGPVALLVLGRGIADPAG